MNGVMNWQKKLSNIVDKKNGERQSTMDERWVNTFGAMTYGIYVLTTFHEQKINGMIASWVSQVSYDPPVVMVAVHPNRYSHQLIRESGCFALHILSRNQRDLLSRFKGIDPEAKFHSIQWAEGYDRLSNLEGLPRISGVYREGHICPWNSHPFYWRSRGCTDLFPRGSAVHARLRRHLYWKRLILYGNCTLPLLRGRASTVRPVGETFRRDLSASPSALSSGPKGSSRVAQPNGMGGGDSLIPYVIDD